METKMSIRGPEGYIVVVSSRVKSARRLSRTANLARLVEAQRKLGVSLTRLVRFDVEKTEKGVSKSTSL